MVLKSGPHFTPQANYSTRFDQSCLDRSYSSDHRAWFGFVHEVIHNATQTLFDHHPSLIRIAVSPLPQPELHKSSYFKMNVDELLVDNTRVALERVWDGSDCDGP